MDAVTAGILLALVALIGSLTVWGFQAGYAAGFDSASLEAERAARQSREERERERIEASEAISEQSVGLANLGGDDLDRLLSAASPDPQAAGAPSADTVSLES